MSCDVYKGANIAPKSDKRDHAFKVSEVRLREKWRTRDRLQISQVRERGGATQEHTPQDFIQYGNGAE